MAGPVHRGQVEWLNCRTCITTGVFASRPASSDGTFGILGTSDQGIVAKWPLGENARDIADAARVHLAAGRIFVFVIRKSGVAAHRA
jgi:hypothetical protein